ncbi:MAG: DUF2804 domain-containing protein, partial [Clostridia bacterium]|nr:DUF2804 domain-containing protein [Clostridia bacterium]
MHNKITVRKKLLDSKGHITECGYATQLILDYNRRDVKACKIRVKEWDYYYMSNGKMGISLTIADNSYMGLASAQVFDYEKGDMVTNFGLVPFPMGRMKLPSSSVSGNVSYKSKKIQLDLINNGASRRLYCNMPDFDKGKQLIVDVTLSELPEDTMVIVTPFSEDKKAFYYNQKINCMKVSGSMTYGEKQYDLNDFLAVLDWGRGV